MSVFNGYGGGSAGTGTVLGIAGAAALLFILNQKPAPAPPAPPSGSTSGTPVTILSSQSAGLCPAGYNFTPFSSGTQPSGSGLCCPPTGQSGPCIAVSPLPASGQLQAAAGILSAGASCPASYPLDPLFNACTGSGQYNQIAESDDTGGINDTGT